jgi:predicted phosphodiesterase
MTQPEIAKQIEYEFPGEFPRGISRDMIKNAISRAKEKATYLSQSPVAQIMPYFDKYKEYIEGVEVIAKNEALLSKILAKPKRDVLVASDFHIPFCNEVALQKAIDQNRNADILVIAGDFLEFYNTSRWRKRDYIPTLVELDNGVRMLEYLSSVFPVVLVVPGNHDNRPMKQLKNIVPAELFWLLESADPLEMLTRPFANVLYSDSWYLQLGDALIAHAERSSTIEGRPGMLLAEYFLPGGKGWASRLNLGEMRCFIVAHTHQISAAYREGIKTLECGCLSNTLEYTTDAAAVMRPALNGYVKLVQYNGRTDFNQTREYIL